MIRIWLWHGSLLRSLENDLLLGKVDTLHFVSWGTKCASSLPLDGFALSLVDSDFPFSVTHLSGQAVNNFVSLFDLLTRLLRGGRMSRDSIVFSNCDRSNHIASNGCGLNLMFHCLVFFLWLVNRPSWSDLFLLFFISFLGSLNVHIFANLGLIEILSGLVNLLVFFCSILAGLWVEFFTILASCGGKLHEDLRAHDVFANLMSNHITHVTRHLTVARHPLALRCIDPYHFGLAQASLTAIDIPIRWVRSFGLRCLDAFVLPRVLVRCAILGFKHGLEAYLFLAEHFIVMTTQAIWLTLASSDRLMSLFLLFDNRICLTIWLHFLSPSKNDLFKAVQVMTYLL